MVNLAVLTALLTHLKPTAGGDRAALDMQGVLTNAGGVPAQLACARAQSNAMVAPSPTWRRQLLHRWVVGRGQHWVRCSTPPLCTNVPLCSLQNLQTSQPPAPYDGQPGRRGRR